MSEKSILWHGLESLLCTFCCQILSKDNCKSQVLSRDIVFLILWIFIPRSTAVWLISSAAASLHSYSLFGFKISEYHSDMYRLHILLCTEYRQGLFTLWILIISLPWFKFHLMHEATGNQMFITLSLYLALCTGALCWKRKGPFPNCSNKSGCIKLCKMS